MPSMMKDSMLHAKNQVATGWKANFSTVQDNVFVLHGEEIVRIPEDVDHFLSLVPDERINEIFKLLLKAFGSLAQANSWWREFHPALGTSPAVACDYPAGQDRIVRMLSAICCGGEL